MKSIQTQIMIQLIIQPFFFISSIAFITYVTQSIIKSIEGREINK